MKIGVTGSIGAGKDTAARYLVGRGYTAISLSDYVRQETSKRGLEQKRENWQMVGNDMRGKQGADVLAKFALAEMVNGGNYVITSIRNPREIKTFEKSGDFTFVNIHCNAEERYRRVVGRGTGGEGKISFEEFLESERVEESKKANGLRMGDCINLATITIKNEGSEEELKKEIERVLGPFL